MIVLSSACSTKEVLGSVRLGSMSFGSRSLAGIGATNELGYTNSIGKNLIASGRFNIGEDVRWSSFSKTFDVQGQE